MYASLTRLAVHFCAADRVVPALLVAGRSGYGVLGESWCTLCGVLCVVCVGRWCYFWGMVIAYRD